MSKIVVEIGGLRSGADELEQRNEQFRNAINELENLEGRLNGMWDGEANDTFHQAFTNDKIQMTNFYNAIAQYVATLRSIADRYQQAEINNTDTARTRSY